MENAAGIGTVTSEMVEARARELAAINGRPSSKPSEADYQQAKRELTGEAEMDPQEESSESTPESEGWDPVPGSTGRQAADSLGEDEDAEGRSESAQMFEEGVTEAEHELQSPVADQSNCGGVRVGVGVTEADGSGEADCPAVEKFWPRGLLLGDGLLIGTGMSWG